MGMRVGLSGGSIRNQIWTMLLAAACLLVVAGETARGQVVSKPIVQLGLGTLESAAISGDGKRILTGSWNGKARLWDTATGQCLSAFDGETYGVNAVALSKDGTLAVTGDSDFAVRLWDATTGRCMVEFPGTWGHTDIINAVAFSADAKKVLTSSDDQTARLWDAQTGAMLKVLHHPGYIRAIDISADGTKVVTGGDGTAQIWDAATGKTLQILKPEDNSLLNCLSVSISPDGQKVLTGGQSLKLWDSTTGKLIKTFNETAPWTYSVAFSPDGAMAASGVYDRVKIWDTTTSTLCGKLIKTIPADNGYITGVGFACNATRLMTASKSQSVVRTWDLTNMTTQPLQMITGPASCLWSAFSPDGTEIMTWGGVDYSGIMERTDSTVRLWDAATGKQLQWIDTHSPLSIPCLSFFPDGTKILVGNIVWDLTQGKKLQQFLSGYAAAPSPDGTKVLIGDQGNGITRLYDVQTGNILQTFTGHQGAIWGVAFSPDQMKVLTGSGDNTAKLWDAATGELQFTLTGHQRSITSVAISPDGGTLLTGSEDGTAKLWDSITGGLIRTLTGHTDEIKAVAFSPDGSMVLTGAYDRTARLWETASGKLLRTYAPAGNFPLGVLSVAFSPDGTRILTGNNDGVARLWWVMPPPAVSRWAQYE